MIDNDTLTTVIIRSLGKQDYVACWQAMKAFTNHRDEKTSDQIWLLEHPPIYTQGQNGKPEHVLNPGAIPIVQSDRGGQVTYHGPGQLVAYILIDMKRKKWNIRELVTHLEQAVIQLLATYHIHAVSNCKAPGVYVDSKKICSVGLRIRRGCSYHGLALNVDMDLEPFSRINPCGYPELKMTQLIDLAPAVPAENGIIRQVENQLIGQLATNLGYTNLLFNTEPLYGT